MEQLHRLVLAVHTLPLPVVCAVNGPCAGGGLGLALACDFVWASQTASFAAAFSAIALTPDTGTSFLLTQAVGVRGARELFLSNRRVKADEALSLGIVSRVLPPDELLPRCSELAARLAAGPTDVLGRTKAMVNASLRCSLAEQLDTEVASALECIGSADLAEGVAAFLEKRPPQFRGRD